MATTAEAPSLNKLLVSTGKMLLFSSGGDIDGREDKKTRDKAIKSVAAFLSQTDVRALPEHETTKLWKGIFYCACASAACSQT
jgi:hypothetical protein